jgi:thioredoxin reductase (NADPH)
MDRRLWISAVGVALTAIAAWLIVPRSSYEPGQLLAAHAQLEGECTSCHRPWRGPQSDACISCHGDLGDSNKHAGVDAHGDSGLLTGKNLALTSLNNLECLSCHGEHLGRAADTKVLAATACTFCHKHPAIRAVPEHVIAEMKRQFLVRHLFAQPFNHYEHRLLITSAYPSRPGGFNCRACHLVEPVTSGAAEEMRFAWSGCAGTGCHVTPQDGHMRMPASVGPSPEAIAYSGVLPVRHINAVFTHSAGHLRSGCEECHVHAANSRNPNDPASLALRQCFTCHAHQPPALARADADGVDGFAGVAFAAAAVEKPRLVEKTVVKCGECHLFHVYGVLPIKDFPSPAPKFPKNRRHWLALILYVPHLRPPGNSNATWITLQRTLFSPWWIGLLGCAVLGFATFGWIRLLPHEQAAQEVVSGVAPQVAKEVPAIDDTYQTNVPHLYIVGEASGTASINLAMRTGRQVIEAVANELRAMRTPARQDVHNVVDVVIVGCGPAGLGATATAKGAGLTYVTLEKMTPASTLRSYPRAKFVQATPIDIAEYGSFFLEGDNSREELIALWDKVIAQAGLYINEREEVVDIRREPDCLVVTTARASVFRGRCVVLAIGVRGNPRHLNLAGETPARVIYNLIEPGEYRSRKILVVGGGNAGAEVVQALAAQELGNTVSYSFRSPVLTNVTRENAERISALQQLHQLAVYPSSALKEIRAATVVLNPVKSRASAEAPAGTGLAAPFELDNDVIFAMIGAELPTNFLKSLGIKMVSKGGWQA